MRAPAVLASPRMSSVPRGRRCVVLAACAIATCAPLAVPAQPADPRGSGRTFEALPIVLVVPFAPRGAAARVANVVADLLAKALRRDVQTRSIESKVGVGALDAVAAPNANEIRLGYATNTQLIEGTLFGTRDTYNALRDFEWIGVVGALPNAVVLGPKSGAATFDQWLATLPKDRTQRWGVGANSSSGHFAAQFLANAAGLKVELVTFLAADAAYDALTQGQIDANFDLLPNAMEEASRGVARIIAVTSKARASALPSIPAWGERWPEESFSSLAALAVSLKETEEIRARLRSGWYTATQNPDTRRRLQEIGVVYSGLALDAAREEVSNEFLRHARLLTRFQSAR